MKAWDNVLQAKRESGGWILTIKNVLVHESNKEIPHDAFDEEKEKMIKYITKHGAVQVDAFITLIKKAFVEKGAVCDFQIILPIDKAVPNLGRPKYNFYTAYRIEGCIMSKYQGHFLPPKSRYKELEEEIRAELEEIEKEGKRK